MVSIRHNLSRISAKVGNVFHASPSRAREAAPTVNDAGGTPPKTAETNSARERIRQLFDKKPQQRLMELTARGNIDYPNEQQVQNYINTQHAFIHARWPCDGPAICWAIKYEPCLLEAERRLLALSDQLKPDDEKSCKRLSDQLIKGTLDPGTKFIFSIALFRFHSPEKKMLKSDIQKIMKEIGGGFEDDPDSTVERITDYINNVDASLGAFYLMKGNEHVMADGLIAGANKTEINTRRQAIFNQVVLD